jgi:hypothetical protein
MPNSPTPRKREIFRSPLFLLARSPNSIRDLFTTFS